MRAIPNVNPSPPGVVLAGQPSDRPSAVPERNQVVVRNPGQHLFTQDTCGIHHDLSWGCGVTPLAGAGETSGCSPVTLRGITSGSDD